MVDSEVWPSSSLTFISILVFVLFLLNMFMGMNTVMISAAKAGCDSLSILIGNTPLLRLDRLRYWLGEQTRRWSSMRRRSLPIRAAACKGPSAAWSMLREGIREKKLTRDKIIIDSSSGNTGIAYAMIGAALGFQVELRHLPENAKEKAVLPKLLERV